MKAMKKTVAESAESISLQENMIMNEDFNHSTSGRCCQENLRSCY